MRDERARTKLARLLREPAVLERRERLFLDSRRAVAVVVADSGAVGIAPALLRERVGRLQQPEGRAYALTATGHPEQPAHRARRYRFRPAMATRTPLELASAFARRAVLELRSAGYAWRAGMLVAEPPRRTIQVFRAIDKLGQLGGGIAIAALRHEDRVGLIDELGSLTFAELDQRSDALACALRARGVADGSCIGILARNHRGFLDITFAGSKAGARMLYLNTDFAAPQLRDVCEREGVTLLVHDQEYDGLMEGIEPAHGRLHAWTDAPGDADTLEALIAAHAGQAPEAPGEPSRVVLLTSGTTGTPKGAPREQGHSLHPIGALLSKVPYRHKQASYVAAPMFHGLGFTQMVLAVTLG